MDRARSGSPLGITAVGIFLLFGAVMASLAGLTLAWPGTGLDRIWTLNPRAYGQLAPFGRLIGIPFLLLGASMFVTATGWFRRRLWSWRLAVAIIATQMLGDLFNALTGHFIEGAIGVVIAGSLLVYLSNPGVRRAFGNARDPTHTDEASSGR